MKFLFSKFKEKILTTGLNMSSSTIKVAAVDTAAYTADQDTDQFLSIVPSGDVIARSGALTSKTFTGGLFDAENTTITPTGDTFEALILFRDTGSDASSEVIMYIDSSYVGLPFTPSSSTTIIQWPSAGIFRL